MVLDRLGEALKRTKSARAAYRWAVGDFLFWNSGREISGARVLDYLDFRERQGDGHHTLKMRFYALKFFLNEVLGAEWRPKETAIFSTRERRKKPEPPVFGREEVLEIIKAVRENGNTQQRAIFAVSTTYGCRRAELADIRAEDLDFGSHTILIFSRKGGREAKHPIPPAIEPYLKAYSWEPIGLSTLSELFQAVMELAFGRRLPGVGFHAIRHALVTELSRTELRAEEIFNFMRWAEPGILPIYRHYKPGEIEEKVFKVHPFLEGWQ